MIIGSSLYMSMCHMVHSVTHIIEHVSNRAVQGMSEKSSLLRFIADHSSVV